MRFLDLVGCSKSDPFTIGFGTPGARSGSVSCRWVSGGEISRFGGVLESDPLTFDFDTPGARSGSESSRWVSGGEFLRFGRVVSKWSFSYRF